MPGSKNIWRAVHLVGVLLMFPAMAWSQCPTENPIIAASEMCPGSVQECSVTFDRSASNTYMWEVMSGGTIIGDNTGPQVSIQWDPESAASHEVRLTERQGNCFYENQMLVSVADDFERGRFNCFGDINIPFDENCERLITPSMLMTAGDLACPDAFDITLTIDGKVIIPNPVPFSYAGQVLIATVVHRQSRISCQTYITLRDGSRPQIECENDTSICLDPHLYDPFGPTYKTPTVSDNCDTSITVRALRSERIELIEDPVFTGFIKRDWAATDKSGNEGFCSDTIWLLRLDFDQLVCPGDTVIPCDSFLANPTDPTIAGAPSFAGYLLYQGQHYCDFTIKYEDQVSPQCHATFVIDRQWTIKTFLEGDEHVFECDQRIQIVDTVGPQVVFADERIKIEQHLDHPHLDPNQAYKTIHFPTLDFGCVANGYFPVPKVFDNCTPEDSIVVDLKWPNGRHHYKASEDNLELIFHDLAYGKHLVEIIARDDCHNQTKDTLVIVTEDKQAPYIVADKDPTVQLTNYAPVTWVDVSNFDEGTYDNCHLLRVLGRRVDWNSACDYTTDTTINSEVRDHYDTYFEWLRSDSLHCGDKVDYGWTDQIPFCCEDACSGGSVAVELMAMDVHCNVSFIWLNVYVEDKTRPEVAVKLPDLEISCKAYHEYYEDQIAKGNWSVFGTYEEAQHSYGDIKDSATQTVFQNIQCYDPPKPIYKEGQVYYNDKPIDYLFYEWVSDTITNGVVFDNCGVDITERQDVHLDKCGEGWIVREFIIKSNCGSEKADSLLIKQKIEIVNDCPFHEEEIIWPKKDTTVYGCVAGEVLTSEPQLRHENRCREIGIHFSDQVTDELYGLDSVCQKIIRTWAVIDWCRQTEDFHAEWYASQDYHYYEYEQIIYVKDTMAPIISDCDIDAICAGKSCLGDLDHTITIEDACTSNEQFEVEWQLYRIIPDGFHLVETGFRSTASADGLEIGEYKLIWSVTDRCNVKGYCTDFFSVVDCKKPTPVCYSATTIKLFPLDLDQNGQIDTAIGEVWASELNQSSFDDCDPKLEDFRIRIKDPNEKSVPDETEQRLSLGCNDVGELLVELWVVDEAGNADFCDVTLIVQAPEGGCPTSSSLQGGVQSVHGIPIQGVEMILSRSNEQNREFTNDKGAYSFRNIQMHSEQYKLKPSLDFDGIEGISTADLISLSKHLLGKKRIGHPLLLMAADADGNGRVSVADLVAIRKLLLGKTDQLPNEKAWYFLNQLGESMSIFSPETMTDDQLYFDAAKVGDVTGDVLSSDASSRSRKSVEVHFQDIYFQPGDQKLVQIFLPKDVEYEGVQASIMFEHDQFEVTLVRSGRDPSLLDSYHHRDNQINLILLQDQHEFQKDRRILEVELIAKHEGWLSDGIGLGQDLRPEAYSTAGQALRLTMRGLRSGNASPLSVKVYPNPMNLSATLDIKVLTTGPAQVLVFDSNGREVHRRQVNLKPGVTKVVLDRNALPINGLYHYRIQHSDQQTSGKLLVVD